MGTKQAAQRTRDELEARADTTEDAAEKTDCLAQIAHIDAYLSDTSPDDSVKTEASVAAEKTEREAVEAENN